MKYFELKCTSYIKKNIELNNSFDILSSYINFSFTKDENLKSYMKRMTLKTIALETFTQ